MKKCDNTGIHEMKPVDIDALMRQCGMEPVQDCNGANFPGQCERNLNQVINMAHILTGSNGMCMCGTYTNTAGIRVQTTCRDIIIRAVALETQYGVQFEDVNQYRRIKNAERHNMP
jgi:hypothetical protein